MNEAANRAHEEGGVTGRRGLCAPRRTAATLSLWSACLLAVGCTSTVVPPAGPDDPVEVFVLAEALHTGIVLPPDPGASGNPDQYVEFGFGDWSWYALGNESWYHVFSTVLWPTQGTLGRRSFGARTADELRRRAGWAELQSLTVSRRKASALRRRLQAEFDGARKRVVVRSNLRFKFVPAGGSYWFLHNCADLATDWLRELDCEIWWCPVRTGLFVEPSQ